MQRRIIIGTLLFVGALAVSTLGAVPSRQSAVVRFDRPTIVAGTFVMGTVLIEHDDAKMGAGQSCTTIYWYDEATKERGKAIVDFMCVPHVRPLATRTGVSCERAVTWPDKLTEFQFLGEREGHGVPDWR